MRTSIETERPPRPFGPDAGTQDSVVVSSGFGRLHLALSAREASDRGLLRVAIMGAYPTSAVRAFAHLLRIANKGRVARLLERDEGIPPEKLRPQLAAELAFELVHAIRRIPILRRVQPLLHRATLRLYGALAARQLSRHADGAKLLHFLAPYGQSSIDRAHELGMIALCDHAIVHPSLIDELVENRGRLQLDRHGRAIGARDPKDAHWRAKLADLARADAVLVNSDFVKETFVAAGWPAERVHVAYLGVDENFVKDLRPVIRTPDIGKLRLLFAGRAERRKGVDVLFEALEQLDDLDWELMLAGPVARDLHESNGALLADRRVRQLGTVLRPRLRELMLSVPVFVFPSFAEGSARVIFEALACGCYVITTTNSGSIVSDGVHGALVPCGDAAALADAIRRADADRARIAEIGTRNAEEVANNFRQVHYGDRLAAVYRELEASYATRRRIS
jgi:glycosyltransferase involved in cell wall biosynthesis